jgi:hypothetical protein
MGEVAHGQHRSQHLQGNAYHRRQQAKRKNANDGGDLVAA